MVTAALKMAVTAIMTVLEVDVTVTVVRVGGCGGDKGGDSGDDSDTCVDKYG
jgi:hypothetical protein